MLRDNDFNLWADDYDKTVGVTDEENLYPFAGYKKLLEYIFLTIIKNSKGRKTTVLDIGFGTGTLTTKLYEHGCSVYGQDFSAKMIEIAHKKMPNAHLYQGDFSNGLVECLKRKRYDYIIATYSLHHLTNEQKISFLYALRNYLTKAGKIVIGDVAFETRKDLERCKSDAGEKWDNDEIYFVIEELKSSFPDLSYIKMSQCAGVMILDR